MSHLHTSVDVTAMGLVSSVGHDVVTACAAIRARISRPNAIPATSTIDTSADKPMPLTGHPVIPITNGFVGPARWLQLAPRAFDDLLRDGQLPGPEDSAFWTSTAVVLLLPDLEESRFEHVPRSSTAEIWTSFVEPLRRRLPPSLPSENVRVRSLGRVGLASIVGGFRELTEELRVDRIIILSVDSHLCPFALNWLGESGRLKDSVNPVGLVPGEAAAALMLEGRQRGAQRPVVARIVALTTETDASLPAPEDEQSPPIRGRALADLLRPVLTTDTGDLYLDLNGEEWRAQEYGHAANALAPWESKKLVVHCPAAEIGDVGAAAFAVNTILAARSLQRRYAHGGQVAVATSSEAGKLAALLVRS